MNAIESIILEQYRKTGQTPPPGLMVPAVRAKRGTGAVSERKERTAFGGMNGMERDYAIQLDLLKSLGDVTFWAFNEVRFKLADGAWFKPDFFVIYPDGHCELHETKGFCREAAILRMKVAASRFPLRWRLVFRTENGWEFRDY